jgi:Holliday junction resolvase-like predicted endonuclease
VSIECNLIISLLKLPKNEPALIENVNRDARLPSKFTRKLLEIMQNEGLVYLKADCVEVYSSSRLELAVKAATLGADMQHVGRLLCWQEFEEMAAYSLKNNGYSVLNNVHFKQGGRRWEMDVVGCKKPLVLCIDCKHWQHTIAPSALQKIVDAQVQRTRAMAGSLPNAKLKLDCTKWKEAKFIPAILSLVPSSFKFIDEIPIVPILSLQDFIVQLPVYMDSVKFFSRSFVSLGHDF